MSFDLDGARRALAGQSADDRYLVFIAGDALDVRGSLSRQERLGQGRGELGADGVGAAEPQNRLRSFRDRFRRRRRSLCIWTGYGAVLLLGEEELVGSKDQAPEHDQRDQ